MATPKVIEPKYSAKEQEALIALYQQAQVDIENKLDETLLDSGLAKDPTRVTQYLQGLKDNVDRILSGLEAGTTQWADTQLPAIYKEATAQTDEQVASLIQQKGAKKALESIEAMPEGVQKAKKLAAYDAAINGRPIAFGMVHQQAANVLAGNLANALGGARYTIGRKVDDIYRNLSLDAARGTVMGYDAWRESARNLRQNLKDEGLTAFTDKAGRKWQLGKYANMAVRTTAMEAHLTGSALRIAELGGEYVRVSTHVGSCPMCYFYQGAVLSINGSDPNVPSLDSAKDNGLFHPNCRHAFGLYDPALLDPTLEQYENSRWLSEVTPAELKQVHSLFSEPHGDANSAFERKMLADYLVKQHGHEAMLAKVVKEQYHGSVDAALKTFEGKKYFPGDPQYAVNQQQVETLKRWAANKHIAPWPEGVIAQLKKASNDYEAHIAKVQGQKVKGGPAAGPAAPKVATPSFTPAAKAKAGTWKNLPAEPPKPKPAPPAQKAAPPTPAPPKPAPAPKAPAKSKTAKVDPFTKHDADFTKWVKESTTAGRQWVDRWYKRMSAWGQSSAAYRAMRRFTASGYTAMNRTLRGDMTLRHEQSRDKDCNAFRDGINREVLEEGITVSRKVGGMFLKDEWDIDLTDPAGAAGKCFIDYGFGSTSISTGVWSGTTRTQIWVPPGPGRGVYCGNHSSNPGEREFTLNRGTIFRIVSVTYKPGQGFDVQMEVIDAWPKDVPVPKGKRI